MDDGNESSEAYSAGLCGFLSAPNNRNQNPDLQNKESHGGKPKPRAQASASRQSPSDINEKRRNVSPEVLEILVFFKTTFLRHAVPSLS
jgi:hypothetical protein